VVEIAFSEGGLDRNEIPEWARYLIHLGHSWPQAEPHKIERYYPFAAD